MEYTTFEKTGECISLLGMGTMRLPLKPDGKPDEEASVSLIRKAIDSGINYVDTAYMYHDGQSEVITGKALRDGYREKVLLADKMPIWFAKEPHDMEEIFNTQFQRLGVTVIDMYLIHNISTPVWNRVLKLGLLPFLEKQRELGRIRQIGFSFHDELPVFKEVLDAYPWDFCQIQLNYMDAHYQAGLEGLALAREKGVPVIIMEPLKGGKLTYSIPPAVEQIWETAGEKRSPADWAFRWVADQPGILTILSGMGSVEQLSENLSIFNRFQRPLLTGAEKDMIQQAAETYNRLIPYSCTGCKYCMPCPQGINIPVLIDLYNEWHIYEESPATRTNFGWAFGKNKPSDCTTCRACEEHCPQQLPISHIMKKAADIFE